MTAHGDEIGNGNGKIEMRILLDQCHRPTEGFARETAIIPAID